VFNINYILLENSDSLFVPTLQFASLYDMTKRPVADQQSQQSKHRNINHRYYITRSLFQAHTARRSFIAAISESLSLFWCGTFIHQGDDSISCSMR